MAQIPVNDNIKDFLSSYTNTNKPFAFEASVDKNVKENPFSFNNNKSLFGAKVDEVTNKYKNMLGVNLPFEEKLTKEFNDLVGPNLVFNETIKEFDEKVGNLDPKKCNNIKDKLENIKKILMTNPSTAQHKLTILVYMTEQIRDISNDFHWMKFDCGYDGHELKLIIDNMRNKVFFEIDKLVDQIIKLEIEKPIMTGIDLKIKTIKSITQQIAEFCEINGGNGFIIYAFQDCCNEIKNEVVKSLIEIYFFKVEKENDNAIKVSWV